MEWLLSQWPIVVAAFLFGAGLIYLWKEEEIANIRGQRSMEKQNSAVAFLNKVYEPIAFRVVRDPDNRGHAYNEWQLALRFLFDNFSEVVRSLTPNFIEIDNKHFEKYQRARILVGDLTKREVTIVFPWRIVQVNSSGEDLHQDYLCWTENEVTRWIRSNWDGAAVIDATKIPTVCGLKVYDPSGALHQEVQLSIPAA